MHYFMRLVLTFNTLQVPKIMLNRRIDEEKANTKQGAYQEAKKIKKIEKHNHVSG